MKLVVSQYNPDPVLTAISEAAQAAMMEIASQYAQAKEDCIKAILRQVLKREPLLEDAKSLTLAKHPVQFDEPITTWVYFDNVYLGIMVETTDEIKFIPAQ